MRIRRILPSIVLSVSGAAALLPLVSFLNAQAPTQPNERGGGLVMVSPGPSNFTTKADQLIAGKRWTEAKSVLVDGLHEMPPNWVPIEIHNDEKAPTKRVIVHSWDGAEYLAFTNQHPIYGRGKSSSVWQGPSYSRADYLIAYVDEELGNLAEAAEALDQGLALEPDHPMLLAERALLYEKLRKFDEALKLYQRALDARVWAPNAQIGHVLRGQGYCLVELGRLDAAEEAYRKSLVLQPGNLSAINELGYIRTHRESPPNQNAPGVNPGGPIIPQRIRIGGNVQMAKLISKVPPVYPPLARQLGVHGVVNFSAVIGKDGTIVNLAVISGQIMLQDAAAEAIRQWVFMPTSLSGQSVEVATTIAVEFKLDEPLPPSTDGRPSVPAN